MFRFMLLGLVGFVLLVSSAGWAAEERKGRILYGRQEGDRVVLHVLKADGTDDQALPGQEAPLNLFPTWSPDGKRVAFMTGGRGMQFRAMLANVDGSNAGPIEAPGTLVGLPAWSPDGKQIAFVAGAPEPGIYLADASGNGARQFSPVGVFAMFPFWSRDGKAIGYTRLKDGEPKGELVLEKLDGGEAEAVTQTGMLTIGGANALSPDGKRLAYLAVDPGARTGSVRILDLASKVESSLAELKLDYWRPLLAPTPAWSPDGKGIVVPITTDKGRGLFLLSDDGKTRTRLTPEGVDCLQAAWFGGE